MATKTIPDPRDPYEFLKTYRRVSLIRRIKMRIKTKHFILLGALSGGLISVALIVIFRLW